MTPFQQMIDALKPSLTEHQLRLLSNIELANWYFEQLDTPTDGPSIDVVMTEAEIARRGLSADELLMNHRPAND